MLIRAITTPFCLDDCRQTSTVHSLFRLTCLGLYRHHRWRGGQQHRYTTL